MQGRYDVVIIGAGIVGCMTARRLARFDLDVLVLERNSDVGAETSAANSALIHAGYDPVPGTLKAELNVRGNAMWEGLARELDFEFRRTGDYVVAVGPDEVEALRALYRQGIANGVPGLVLLDGEAVKARVPLLNPEVSGALYAPTAGVVDPFGATIAAAENAVRNGTEFALETEFEDFIFEGRRIIGVRTSKGEARCDWVINCAGLQSDIVMHRAGCRPEFSIRPRRGEYCVLDPDAFTLDEVLFPVPSLKGKGVLVFTTTHGNTIVGPTSEWVDDRTDASISRTGQAYLEANMKKLVPSIDLRRTIAVFAGLRAAGNARCLNPDVDYVGDFIVERAAEADGLINCGGIESPGLTSAPAIAERIETLIRETGYELTEKADWDPIRKRPPVMRLLSDDGKQRVIAADPRYGRIVCRCEMVTEGEIVAAIHSPIPARTYDAIKRRTWLGTGRCQGGFDLTRVVGILSRELGIPADQVRKNNAGSEFVFGETKDGGSDESGAA